MTSMLAIAIASVLFVTVGMVIEIGVAFAVDQAQAEDEC